MKIFQRLTLSIGALLFVSNLNAQTCMPCSYNLDWSNAQSIEIDNSTNAQALTGHQIKITFNSQALIAANEMNADGSDLRFTSDCSDNLSYWIEDGINTPTTNVWVKLSTVAANAVDTIHMFYGNPAAVAQSSGDNTFEFFDDFEGSALDLAKWEVRGTPNLSLSGGMLNLSGNNNWEYIRSNVHFTQQVVIEETNSKYAGGSFGFLMGYSGSDNRYTFRTAGTDLGCTEDPDVSAAAFGSRLWCWSSRWSSPSAASWRRRTRFRLARWSGRSWLATTSISTRCSTAQRSTSASTAIATSIIASPRSGIRSLATSSSFVTR